MAWQRYKFDPDQSSKQGEKIQSQASFFTRAVLAAFRLCDIRRPVCLVQSGPCHKCVTTGKITPEKNYNLPQCRQKKFSARTEVVVIFVVIYTIMQNNKMYQVCSPDSHAFI